MTRDEALESVTVGLPAVLSEDGSEQGPSWIHLQPISTVVVLDGGIVMDNMKDLPLAFACYFGLPKMHGKYTSSFKQ